MLSGWRAPDTHEAAEPGSRCRWGFFLADGAGGQAVCGGDWHTQASDRGARPGVHWLQVWGQPAERAQERLPQAGPEGAGGAGRGGPLRPASRRRAVPERVPKAENRPSGLSGPRHRELCMSHRSPRPAGENVSRTRSSRLSPGWRRTPPCCGGRRSPPRSAGGSR